VDYKKSNFNRIIQSKRAIGSAIKPFVYQIALNLGYNPASMVPDISRTYKIPGKTPQEDKFWRPKNYEKNTLGFITLREALVHSRNLATINLTSMIGLDMVINGLYKFGFDKVPENMSIVLGSFGVSPLKIAEEYTLFSNYGKKVKPRLILNIQNEKKGLSIIFPIQKDEIISPSQAYLMIDILRDVVKKGTGRNARLKDIQVAGKTGTTNNFRDAWWCGFTPDTTTIVWYGNDDNTPLGKKMSGGRVSAPVFKYFYKKYLQIHPELKREFKVPKGIYYFNYNGNKELFTKTSSPPLKKVYVPIY
jgi:penicillin-binding protein 1A